MRGTATWPAISKGTPSSCVQNPGGKRGVRHLRWECEVIHLRLKGQILFFSETLVKLRAHLSSRGRGLGSHLLAWFSSTSVTCKKRSNQKKFKRLSSILTLFLIEILNFLHQNLWITDMKSPKMLKSWTQMWQEPQSLWIQTLVPMIWTWPCLLVSDLMRVP